MIKFFRKIRQNLLSEGRNGKYSKYAIGITIAILITACKNSNENTAKLNEYISSAVKKEMWEEPRHQLILSKSGIKVMDIRIPPKDTTEYHLHNFATLYNLISDANLASQEYGKKWSFKSEKQYRKSGTFSNWSKEYIENNSYHRVANIDTSVFHLIGIVNTKIYSNTKNENFNDWFIKHQMEVDKMKRSELKEFSNPVLIIQNSIGESSIIQENIIHSFKSEAGAVTWIPRKTQFKLINNSYTTINYTLIELKEK